MEIQPTDSRIKVKEFNLNDMIFSIVSFFIDYKVLPIIEKNICLSRYNYNNEKFNLGFDHKKTSPSFLFLKNCHKQKNYLKNFSLFCIKNNLTFLGHIIDDIRYIISDLGNDSIHGFSDIGKIKIKIILEKLALLSKATSINNYELLESLIFYHTCYKNSNLLLQNFSKEQILEEAYDKNKNYISITKDQFKKYFNNSLGYLLQESDNLNYTTLVYQAIKNAQFNNFDEKKQDIIKTHLKLAYIESLNCGHANGYLYNCSCGSFNDLDALIIGVDNLLIDCLYKVRNAFSISKNEVKKLFIDKINQLIKSYSNCANEKYKIICNISKVPKPY